MAAGPIPWSSIVLWAGIHDLNDPDDIALLNHHIRAMESAVRKHDEQLEKSKK